MGSKNWADQPITGRRVIDIVAGRHVGHVAGPFPRQYLPKTDDYLAWFENMFGEELVLVQKRGEPTATLYHSDCNWEPITITDAVAMRGDFTSRVLRHHHQRDEPIDWGMEPATNLGAEEQAWLLACWRASAGYRNQEGLLEANEAAAQRAGQTLGQELYAQHGAALAKHPNSAAHREAWTATMLAIGIRAGQLSYENSASFQTAVMNELHLNEDGD